MKVELHMKAQTEASTNERYDHGARIQAREGEASLMQSRARWSDLQIHWSELAFEVPVLTRKSHGGPKLQLLKNDSIFCNHRVATEEGNS